MNSLLRLLLFVLMVSLSPQVGGQEPVAIPLKVALVSAEKADSIRTVLTLAEAKLGELREIHLLDRQAIDRVIAEQKLSLSGLVAAEQALTIGKILSVDLFAVLEAGLNKKEAVGLVVFDARTGVRLWDAALPTGDLNKTVDATVASIKSVQRKRQALAKLRPVCLLTVRNADLPREWDAFCDSVGLLLERQVVASPDLAVLERRRLDQINKERNLPADSPLRQLLASVVTVELEIAASADGKGLLATALLSDSGGKVFARVTAKAASRDGAVLSRMLFKDIATALNATGNPLPGDPVREALRFALEADFLWNHREEFPPGGPVHPVGPGSLGESDAPDRCVCKQGRDPLGPATAGP